MARLPLLDGWRGVAIILLLIGHFGQLPGQPFYGAQINFARVGVEFFFVLSGTLMGKLLFLRKTELPVFYRRRISRIFPGALVYILLITIMAWNSPLHVTPWQALAGATFTYNYLIPVVGSARLIEHFWSLCVEEHSYILLGLIALYIRRKNVDPVRALTITAAVIVVITLIWGTKFHWHYYRTYWLSHTRSLSIVLGALFVVLQDRGRLPTSSALALAGIVVGFWLQYEPVHEFVKYSLGTMLLAFAVNRADYMPGFVKIAMAWAPLRTVGWLSYSIYLWQQPFYQNLFPGGVAGALVAAFGSFFLIENPVRTYLNATWAKSPVKPQMP